MSRLITFALLIAGLLASSLASATPIAPPDIAARAWILVDYDSGQVLAAKEPDQRLEPASLTKIMTTYLVAKALKEKRLAPEQIVTISERAWRTYGSRSFLQVGTQVSVDVLLKGMIVQSGNDAAVALGEAVSSTEDAFARAMTQEAKRLGLANTNFLNASGFFDNAQPEHYSTARDMALLAAALMRDYPEVHALHAMKEFTYGKIRQHNRNRLLWLDPTVDGLKTGHSDNAGYCLTATAKRGTQRLIGVVLGTASDNVRTAEMQKLLNWGYQAFDTVRLYAKDESVAQAKIFKGVEPSVGAGFTSDFALALPKGRSGNPTTKITLKSGLLAPLKRGDVVGTLEVSIEGQPLGEYPLIALQDVAQAGILGRVIDSVKLWFVK
jgi:D-alanyl-D-alanine carboxypeptidase (penicillin-binding protein 5/6)